MGFTFPGAPYFDGAMTSEGSGARVRLDVKDIPVIGDVNVVNVSVPGFKRGGQIPTNRAQATEAAQARRRRGPLPINRAQADEANITRRAAGGTLPTNRAQATEAGVAARRRQGGASAPTRRSPNPPRPPRHSGGRQTGIGADMAALTPASVGLSGGGPVGFHAAPGARREKWEICPGIACPLCAAGITIPVR